MSTYRFSPARCSSAAPSVVRRCSAGGGSTSNGTVQKRMFTPEAVA